jgi:putative transposase
VSTIKRECLDRFIVFGENHLRYIVEQYSAYYNAVRPHQGVGNEPVGVEKMPSPESVEEKDGVVCDVWLGGLLRHYRKAAA